jgi:hypothetical protein
MQLLAVARPMTATAIAHKYEEFCMHLPHLMYQSAQLAAAAAAVPAAASQAQTPSDLDLAAPAQAQPK